MPLKGFPGHNAFGNSKVSQKKIIKDTGRKGFLKGDNSSKMSSLRSGTKSAKNPTN